MVFTRDESMVVLVRPVIGSLTYSLYSVQGNGSWVFENSTQLNFSANLLP